MKKKLIIVIIALLATVFFCYPYLNNLNIEAHDFQYHLTRIQQISNEISKFNIPVMIHSELVEGLGYANSIFYPELFLYIPAVIHLLGISLLTSYKIFIMMTTFFTFILTYKVAKEISKNIKIGIVTSLLYTFCLYRIVDVYTRAALGEVISFVFLPLIILGIYELIYQDGNKWWILPLGIFGIANCHIISFVMSIAVVLFFLIINIRKIIKDKKIKKIFVAGIVSIMLVLSVFIPILEQVQNMEYRVFANGTGEELSTKSLLITQLFMNKYTYNVCRTNAQVNDQMNFGNGILLLVLPAFILITKWKDEKEKRFIWQIFILGILAFIMTTIIFPWQYFRIFNFIQLPWRLNAIISLCFAIVGTYTFYYSIKNKDMMYILAIIIVIVTANYLDNVSYSNQVNPKQKVMAIGQGEYLPQNLNKEDAYVFDNNTKERYEYVKENGKIYFDVTEEKNSKEINIPLIYYKGYKAYISNGESQEELKVEPNNNGLLLLENESLKTGTIKVEYKMTIIQKISYIITYTTILLLTIYILYKEIKREK